MNNNKAVTLVEVLVASTILVIVIVAAMMVFQTNFRIAANNEDVVLAEVYIRQLYENLLSKKNRDVVLEEIGPNITSTVNFNYPIETADILTAHLKFAAWAQSGGVDFEDWYMDEPGYRNEANIYVIP